MRATLKEFSCALWSGARRPSVALVVLLSPLHLAGAYCMTPRGRKTLPAWMFGREGGLFFRPLAAP
jgi:hypothetical protein